MVRVVLQVDSSEWERVDLGFTLFLNPSKCDYGGVSSAVAFWRCPISACRESLLRAPTQIGPFPILPGPSSGPVGPLTAHKGPPLRPFLFFSPNQNFFFPTLQLFLPLFFYLKFQTFFTTKDRDRNSRPVKGKKKKMSLTTID